MNPIDALGPQRAEIDEPRVSPAAASHGSRASAFVHGVRHLVGGRGVNRVGLADPWPGQRRSSRVEAEVAVGAPR